MEIKDRVVREKLSNLHVLLSQLWMENIITQNQFLTKLRSIHHAVSGWQTAQKDRRFILKQLDGVECDLRAELEESRAGDQ